jgi:cellulose synthase/poly-beta-1,6-N-acetylglucosamine synthase-like glycosyltransferase
MGQMNKQNQAQVIKILYYFVWILIIIHLYKGIEELFGKELKFWQITVISLQLTFEVIVLSQINLLLNSIRIVLVNPINHPELTEMEEFPEIDVVIPTRRVDPGIVEATLIGFQNQSYPRDKLHIYIADDTPESESIKELSELADKYQVNYISKPENVRFKSGMLNLVLPTINSEFIAFFDHDQIPAENIIVKFIQIFNAKPEIDFIQSKKVFRSLDNLFKVWSALLYALYFEVFERSKQFNDVVLFAGSTACFRRQAIDAVGGIPEDTFTEDNGLSVKLILNGSRGYYYDQIGSIGAVPPTFPLQIAQLWRWSNGASHVMKNNFHRLMSSKNINFGQKMDIMATFGISPLVVFIYIYGFSFIPLVTSGVDSSRLIFFGISSVIFVPLFAAITYTVLASVSISLAKSDGVSEFKLSHLPGFLFVALASNLLILTSGLSGIFGKLGPDSKFGVWTREVHIRIISSVSLIIGIIVMIFAVPWFLDGFASAGLLIILGLTMFPSFIVVFLIPRARENGSYLTTVNR